MVFETLKKIISEQLEVDPAIINEGSSLTGDLGAALTSSTSQCPLRTNSILSFPTKHLRKSRPSATLLPLLRTEPD